MSWKKHFRPVNSVLPIQDTGSKSSGYTTTSKFSSWLPEIYQGPPDRLQRYTVYEAMNYDHEVNAALDTISDFCTEIDEVSSLPFVVNYLDDPSPVELSLIEKSLKQWCVLNDFNKRLWKLFRLTLMYGDQFFVRDPASFKLFWLDPNKVMEVIVNESQGKKTEAYFVKDLDLNIEDMIATNQSQSNSPRGSAAMMFSPPASGGGFSMGSYTAQIGSGGTANEQSVPIDANHIVHVTLSDGMSSAWPFGESVLEYVYKVYKQKELLEDSILIYRVHRAPERRVFFIDVGSMPPNKAQQYLERVKYEVQQKRIPSRSGGGANIADSTYNPMSSLEDYYFATTCLSLETKMPLLDGRELTLEQMIDEYNDGKVNYVYSQSADMQLEAGKVCWAGVTRKDAEVVRVHLDNGEFVDATPDHIFIMRDGNEVFAGDLQEGDSLMPLYLIESKTSPKQKGKPYLRYIDNSDEKVKWVHTSICGKTEEDSVIHHVDFNSRNNNPENLMEMDRNAHIEYHKSVGSFSLKKQWDSPAGRSKLVDGINRFHKNRSKEDDEKLSARNRKNALSGYANNEEFRSLNGERMRRLQKRVTDGKRIKYTDEMFNRVDELFREDGITSIPNMCKVLRDDVIFQDAYLEANPGIIRDSGIIHLRPSDTTLNKIVAVKGFSSWGDYKVSVTGLPRFSNKAVNHKVARIEKLSHTMDTGDITIETESGSHIFALSSGIFVHNSDGRGSKVETLPGGENLGDIDDLRYFNNKMLRALGVPSSYLPSGPEDGSASYNDGRVGSAFIQEFRFSKVCERYQKKIIKTLDEEFKLFLKFKGISIDNSIFELNFTKPQSFSEYRQMELDATHINAYQAIAENPMLSERFKLKRYLGLTEEEIMENERLWKEEKGDKDIEPSSADAMGLSDAGISASGIEGMSPDEGFDDSPDEFGDDEDIDGFVDDEVDDFGKE